jgi:hypothetical protein
MFSRECSRYSGIAFNAVIAGFKIVKKASRFWASSRQIYGRMSWRDDGYVWVRQVARCSLLFVFPVPDERSIMSDSHLACCPASDVRYHPVVITSYLAAVTKDSQTSKPLQRPLTDLSKTLKYSSKQGFLKLVWGGSTEPSEKSEGRPERPRDKRPWNKYGGGSLALLPLAGHPSLLSGSSLGYLELLQTSLREPEPLHWNALKVLCKRITNSFRTPSNGHLKAFEKGAGKAFKRL